VESLVLVTLGLVYQIPPSEFWCDPSHQTMGALAIGAILTLFFIKRR
jgi:hypothetical protein